MPLVDSHCHLQSEKFGADRDAVVARTLAALDWAVVIGDDLPSSAAGLALARAHEGLYATVGLHPYYAADCDPAALAELRTMAADPKVRAIGEIGLDYFNVYATPEVQAQAFRAQLDLALELGLPVVIHNRESDADALAILLEYAPRLAGCVMHCFGSGPETAAASVAAGFYVSFAGNVTFPKAQNLRDAAMVVPLDRLLIETDAPYLAPVPLRGQRCEPGHVAHTADFLAALRGVEVTEFGAITTENARRLYRV